MTSHILRRDPHMALVKTTKIGSPKSVAAATPTKAPAAVSKLAVRNRTAPGKATITERVAAATEQLASGITQSSAAAEELRRSMEQIAAGAEEAAGASQEQLGAIKRIIVNLARRADAPVIRVARPRRCSLSWRKPLLSSAIRCAPSNAMPSARQARWTSLPNWNGAPRKSAISRNLSAAYRTRPICLR